MSVNSAWPALSVVAVPTVSQTVPLACRAPVRSTWYVPPVLPVKVILIPVGTREIPVIVSVPLSVVVPETTCCVLETEPAVPVPGCILTTIGPGAGLTVMTLEVTPVKPLALKLMVVFVATFSERLV